MVLGDAAVPGGVTFVGHRQRQAADAIPELRIVPLAALVDRDVVLGPADRRRGIARHNAFETGRLSGNDRNVLQGGNKQGLLGGDGRFLGVLRCAGRRTGATHGGSTGRRVVWSGAPRRNRPEVGVANPRRRASTSGGGDSGHRRIVVPLRVSTGLQIGRRNRRRPTERRWATVTERPTAVIVGSFVNDRNFNGLRPGRAEGRRAQVERMFCGRGRGGTRWWVRTRRGAAFAGHDSVALAGEDYAELVPEIVLEVDDSGVRIDVAGAW